VWSDGGYFAGRIFDERRIRKLQAFLPVMLENEDTISIRFVAWLGSRSTNAVQEGWMIGAMSEPGSYNYPVSEVMQIETHRSWVFLAGDDACKVK